jgi:serine/threonine protein phosphatase PrpC
MSRSIGDHEWQKYGVVADPEFTEREISINDKILIIASDGVWEYLSNEDVMNIWWKLRTHERVTSNFLAKTSLKVYSSIIIILEFTIKRH